MSSGGRRRRSARVGDPHLRLVKSDGVFADIAEANRLVHLAAEREKRRAEQCGLILELKMTPTGAEISPHYWIPLRCVAAPRHVGPCMDEVGILFSPRRWIGAVEEYGAVTDWAGYSDADIYDLAMALKEGE